MKFNFYLVNNVKLIKIIKKLYVPKERKKKQKANLLLLVLVKILSVIEEHKMQISN
jgi:hypothetical protein